MLRKIQIISIVLTLLLIAISCEEFLIPPEPSDKLTPAKMFSGKNDIQSVVFGIYSKLSSGWTLGGSAAYRSQFSDESYLNPPDASNYVSSAEYTASNSEMLSAFWSTNYSIIYDCNMFFEQMAKSKAELTEKEKNDLIGQVHFIRAFSYFDLVQYYGDVPIVLSSIANETKYLPREPKSKIYEQILDDLSKAAEYLPAEPIKGLDNRFCNNKYVVKAFLARVYLFMGRWADAEKEATEVIESGRYFIESDLSVTMSRNSYEVIFSLGEPVSWIENRTFVGTTFQPLTGAYTKTSLSPVLLKSSKPATVGLIVG